MLEIRVPELKVKELLAFSKCCISIISSSDNPKTLAFQEDAGTEARSGPATRHVNPEPWQNLATADSFDTIEIQVGQIEIPGIITR
jgi:hypothetical protein